MKSIATPIEGVLIIEPDVYEDDRGFFLESYNQEAFADLTGLELPFVQDNHSKSTLHTLRGLHLQTRKPQGKLVRVTAGSIFDVAVDLRKGSQSFLEYFAVELSAENFRQLWIPEGLAHGFLTLSDLAEVQYKVTDFYDPGHEISLKWNDTTLGIPWPVSDYNQVTLSTKDANGSTIEEILNMSFRQ